MTVIGCHDDVGYCSEEDEGIAEMLVPARIGIDTHQESEGVEPHLSQAAVDSSPWGFPHQEVGVVPLRQ